ncbi:MAG: Release factor glutamine methyltransferase [Phycisphaerae bacterium]|nr:Release factor glutamine methyltransferase [Phycisphaerae bacterium]
MNATQPDSGSWTVARLLAWTRDYFEQRHVDSPRLCAELLLSAAMGCERLRLYTQHELVPDASVRNRFREHVQAAAAGKPIAYILGVKEFFSLSFDVTPDVLIPRPETEILVERALAALAPPRLNALRASDPAGPVTPSPPDPPPRVLDLCTGSGCIAIAIARHAAHARLTASDVSDAVIEVARRNALRHAVAERIDFRVGDLFAAFPTTARFDLIVTNPPYVGLSEAATLAANVRDFEPHLALFAGADGLDVVRRIIAEAPQWLTAGGQLLMEIGHGQSAEVSALLSAAGWSDVVFYRDAARHARVAHARRPAQRGACVA